MVENPLNVFVNTGLDDYLAKSFNRSGLVQVLTTVQGKHGQYQRMQWVRPGEAANLLESSFTSAEVTRQDGNVTKPVFIPLADMSKAEPRALTAKQVMDMYNRGRVDGMDLATFAKRNFFISDGINATREVYKRGGGYTKQRQALHKRIVDDIVSQADKAKEGEKPVCILLGGGSASGKSTIRDRFVQPELDETGTRVATVDSDEIKKAIPEYGVFQEQRPDAAAMRVHNESADITTQAIDRLISEKRHFIYDGTMKSLSKYTSIIKQLKDAGYEVRVVAATIPVEDAIARSDDRAKKTGRKVPHSIIRGSHGGCSVTYPQLTGLVDSYELWDNSGERPVLVQDNDGIHDQQLYDAFIKKGADWKAAKAKREADRAAKHHSEVRSYGA
ncbi:MAG: zeta toxin family protein [Lachnospiraceae bacterium]|nr:zeta toxin family protein [Lachnospiraceae bacterium]